LHEIPCVPHNQQYLAASILTNIAKGIKIAKKSFMVNEIFGVCAEFAAPFEVRLNE
jgi:hypothetical protein